MSKIVVITDMDKTGSGYKNLMIPLLSGLAKLGHEIKVAGFAYKGEEHTNPFSIIPADNLRDAATIALNLNIVWKPDIFLVAMDIPLQEFFHKNLQQALAPTKENPKGVKYIAITPLENGPLTMSWAAVLLNMNSVFFISELGKQEAIKAGLHNAEHLNVGIDTVLWHPATPEEKSQIRQGMGIDEDEFVVLTVADNQERKNLWAGMDSIRLLKEQTDRKIRYVLVTRVESPVGHKLNDLAMSLGITKEFMTFNRGMPVEDLWALYAMSDAYLQPSKAEGLGLPVMEAMACGIPCVATDTGALHEVLDDGRGLLIEGEYEFTDVWGNSTRTMISRTKAANGLWMQSVGLNNYNSRMIARALEYIRSRTWDIAVNQIDSKIKELLDEQKAQ